MGVKSKKKAKTRLDAYYRLAKDQGYRARSAFKLIQLNRKYDFLAKSRVLVDLCAAPGGWCQVAAKYMPVGSKIVGVDLVPIAPIRGVKTFVGDITEDKTRKIIITWLKKEPADCVIHDGAPNVGGVWSRDLYDQNALVLASCKMACAMLRPGGWFVTKVFRSQDFHKLLWVFKQLFDKVEATKPLASRMESAEIFVVCAGYKAPKQLDPSMFSAQKVFSEVGEEKIMNPAGILVTPKSNVPQGYEEFATVSHRVAQFTDFLRAKDPKGFIRAHHELRFSNDEDKVFLKSKSSKKELVYLCGDLQQVSDADLRRLLRWRDQLLREQARYLVEDDAPLDEAEDEDAMELGSNASGGDGAVSEDEEALDADDITKLDLDSADGVTRIAQELLSLRKKKAKELKKKEKRLVDRKLKQIKGLINYDPNTTAHQIADEADGVNGEGTGLGPQDAFYDPTEADDETNLDAFTVERLAEVDEAELAKLLDEHAMIDTDDRPENDPLNPVVSVNLAAQEDYDLGKGEEDDDENADETESTVAAEPLSEQLVEGDEYYMDVDNYGNYVSGERSARVKLFEEGLDANEDEEEAEDDGLTPAERKKQKKASKDAADLDEAGKQSKWQRHHLNIDRVLNDTFPKPKHDDRAEKSKARKRQRTLDEERITMTATGPLNTDMDKKRNRTRFDSRDDDDDDDSSDGELSELSHGDDLDRPDLEVREGRVDSRRKKRLVEDLGKLTTQELVRQQRKQMLQDNKETRKQNKRNKNNQNGKEEANEFEEIPIALSDPAIRARTLAIAQKMLDPKSRRDILDASVNKYTYNDDDDLPDWFVKDEQRNCFVQLPVTADEIESQRERFRELNARPSRKVMEAMGRKRRRAQRMLRQLMDKGKADPRAREKATGLSVRKLLRAQVIKGSGKKKSRYLDGVEMGRQRREKQKNRRDRKR